jgi:hypothetical protein
VFENTRTETGNGGTIFYRDDIYVRLHPIPLNRAYRESTCAVGLIPSVLYHERATDLCWDILAATATYSPLPTWLAQNLWSFDNLKEIGSPTPLEVGGIPGFALDARDFSKLIGD